MKTPSTSKHQTGYGLVEMMVAGTLLGLSVIAISVFLRSTTKIQTESDMRRQAAQLLDNALENSAFHPTNTNQFIQIRNLCGTSTQTCSITGATACTLERVVTSYVNYQISGVFVAPLYEARIKINWGIDSLTDSRYITPISFQCPPNDDLCHCP
jgi:Tfp pilus assembly protein PilV